MTKAGPTIALEGVSKWFGRIVAVSDLTFTLGPGVTALLGPNGAGKSTVLRMLAGLTPPSLGRVAVLGRDPRAQATVRGRMALVPQQDGLLDDLTARAFVGLAATLHAIPQAPAAAERALRSVGLAAADDRPLRTYSRGMRQRVKIAQALVSEPDVILLDEPLTGLDPLRRLDVIALLQRLGAEGRTVVVSSHVLDEVARFGSRVLVIARGRLAAEGDFHAIRALMDDRPLRYRVIAEPARRLAAALVGGEGVAGVQVDGDRLIVETDDVPAFRREIVTVSAREGVRLREVVALDDDLDSVFRYLVGD